MKVYVVKNDKNEYMTETGDFIKSLWQAELFYDYECAYCYAPTGCNIVECSLMEKYQLSDYTKQVRKEVCDEVRNFLNRQEEIVKTIYYNSYQMSGLEVIEETKELLDQIQGE